MAQEVMSLFDFPSRIKFFLVNAPLSAIIFPTEIPFLASLTEVNTVRKIPIHWKLRKPI